MIYTNLFKLPEPIVRLVENPTYHAEREKLLKAYLNFKGLPADTPHYSVSDLIKAPRQVVLAKRYGDKIVRDVSDGMWAMLGSMLHEALHRGARLVNDAGGMLVPEKRLFAVIKVGGSPIVISGEPDLIDGEHISDYKLTGVYAFQKGKIEWEQQLNAYAWLQRVNGDKVSRLSITAFLRDWMKSETVKADYPPAQCATIEIPLWPEGNIADTWLHVRAKALSEAASLPDDRLPECTSDEMWERPETWAVMKKGGARATKVFKTPGIQGNKEAREYAEKLGEQYSVEHRPGERVKCSRGYCDAASFCNQFQEYKGAAWSGRPVKEGDA